MIQNIVKRTHIYGKLIFYILGELIFYYKAHMFYLARELVKFGHVLAEKMVTL